jgi:hypothetical protein
MSSPTSTAEDRLDAFLSEWNSFEECLLHDLRPVHFGYGLQVDIPVLVSLHLMGVQRLEFTGALSPAMLADPEQINWGLTEIANVRRFDVPGLVGLAIEWEGQRQLKVEFTDFRAASPKQP